jgi:hypothetical protein
LAQILLESIAAHGYIRAMKQTLAIVIGSLFLTLSAWATPTWKYGIEPNGVIRGGKIKVQQVGRGSGFRKISLRYDLVTSVGERESRIPYNFPERVFQSQFLSGMNVGETVDLGSVPHGWEPGTENFSITRQTADAYLVTNSDGQFRIFVRAGGGPWKRVEFSVRAQGVSVRLFGNLVWAGEE